MLAFKGQTVRVNNNISGDYSTKSTKKKKKGLKLSVE
jgi:hypothetical protein